jgi:hypothetical protein
MNKSGLADSPFFAAPPQKVEAARAQQALSSPTETKAIEIQPSQEGIQGEEKRTSERSNGRNNERTDIRIEGRHKIRHTFDIFEDQLHALQRMQLEAVQAGKTKPKLGDMVQQALDAFLKIGEKPTSRDVQE